MAEAPRIVEQGEWLTPEAMTDRAIRTIGEFHGRKMATLMFVTDEFMEDAAAVMALRLSAADQFEALLLGEITADGLLRCLDQPHEWMETLRGDEVCLSCGATKEPLHIFRSEGLFIEAL